VQGGERGSEPLLSGEYLGELLIKESPVKAFGHDRGRGGVKGNGDQWERGWELGEERN